METRDIYIEKMKLQLDEINSTLTDFETKARIARNEANEKYLNEMSTLRAQSESAVEKLNELKTASEESWKNMVSETEKVRDAFVKSFHYFKSQP